ncbi:hypothetical protein HE1_00211 [Holospora elegans E1]|uniref:Uncharacterized protein n=1 Tax=Holospora elegans E1 TaxID=1427503 RepID=A0A023DXN7_9PROT|nr:hypothetical protein [Holospora elegans]GAJ45894.1 hypothetical protein HE1_00211 [Holospora elegans E1]
MILIQQKLEKLQEEAKSSEENTQAINELARILGDFNNPTQLRSVIRNFKSKIKESIKQISDQDYSQKVQNFIESFYDFFDKNINKFTVKNTLSNICTPLVSIIHDGKTKNSNFLAAWDEVTKNYTGGIKELSDWIKQEISNPVYDYEKNSENLSDEKVNEFFQENNIPMLNLDLVNTF